MRNPRAASPTGDLVFRNRLPFVGQADSGRWLKALDALLAFDATTIVPGHGPVSTQGHADLQFTRDYLSKPSARHHGPGGQEHGTV